MLIIDLSTQLGTIFNLNCIIYLFFQIKWGSGFNSENILAVFKLFS